MKVSFKILSLIIPAMALLFFGCKDDELTMADGTSSSSSDIEGDCISFTMKLDRDLSSRSDGFLGQIYDSEMLRYESYIDTQDKFRVFFFTSEGDFLFGATDRVVGSLQTTDQAADYWYVRIPMTMLVDRDNQEYDVDKIKNYLKSHSFKIAVLANWPNGGEKVNPADYDDSEGTPTGGENPSSTLKGHPKWNWSNSILNIKADPKDIRNINDLHHVYNDLYYAGESRRPMYEEFMAYLTSEGVTGYYMGEPTDWVKMREIEKSTSSWKANYDLNENIKSFDNKVTANQWIRANWTPNEQINENKAIYRHYQHMWFLWNFDASYKTGSKDGNVEYETDSSGNPILEKDGYSKVKKVKDASSYNSNWGWNDGYTKTDANPWGEEWYKRNGEVLYRRMAKSYNGGLTPEALGDLTIERGHSNNDVFFKYVSVNGSPAYCVKVGENYGIRLPAIGSGPKTSYTGMMLFQARTSGTLRIKWSSADETTESALAIQVGLSGNVGTDAEKNAIYKVHGNVKSTQPVNWRDRESGLEYLDITVSEGSLPVYIYCTQGKAVVYAIEFIRGRYLYETDREGVKPNENFGIPMYGVQDFPAIPDWQRGTTFNLENKVSLVRALAKVEVNIAKKFGEPRHVIMRNMNRLARCEPIDVHTSTAKLWGDENDHFAKDENNNNFLCEWFRIQNYGASYGIENYSDWLSWFYGSWQNIDGEQSERYEPIYWKTSGKDSSYDYNFDLGYHVQKGNPTGWDQGNSFSSKYSKFTEKMTEDRTPPHIFNPYIYRSDFCNFFEVPSASGDYYRYVLYVPEKNIDDPAVVGLQYSVPKVPHIEYRFPPRSITSNVDEPSAVDDGFYNTEYNLDDNDCFRIYFTNYGFGGDGDNVKDLPLNQLFHDKAVTQSGYEAYEKSNSNLSKHWPIMRNHKYNFHVGGEGPMNPEIHVEVSDWGHRKVIVTW